MVRAFNFFHFNKKPTLTSKVIKKKCFWFNKVDFHWAFAQNLEKHVVWSAFWVFFGLCSAVFFNKEFVNAIKFYCSSSLIRWHSMNKIKIEQNNG